MADQTTSQQQGNKGNRGAPDARPRLAMDIAGFADDEHQMKKGQLLDIIKTYEDTGHIRVRTATGHQMVLGPEVIAK